MFQNISYCHQFDGFWFITLMDFGHGEEEVAEVYEFDKTTGQVNEVLPF